MADTQVKVSNITLISQGKIPGTAEVKCPCCGFVNSFPVKAHLHSIGHETATKCGSCGAQIAFRWERG